MFLGRLRARCVLSDILTSSYCMTTSTLRRDFVARHSLETIAWCDLVSSGWERWGYPIYR